MAWGTKKQVPSSTDTKSDQFKRPANNGIWGGVEKVLDTAHDVLIVIPHAYLWITSHKGAAILFGIATIYFALVNGEGYWQASDASNPSFMLKWGIDDAASFWNAAVAATSGSFWLSFIFSSIIQAVQAMVLRGVAIEVAQRQYEEVKGYTVPDAKENAIDIAEVRRKQFKSAGMLEVKKKGFVILATYVVDVIMSYLNYPFLVASLPLFFIRLAWFLLSVFGAELFGAMFYSALQDRSEPANEPV